MKLSNATLQFQAGITRDTNSCIEWRGFLLNGYGRIRVGKKKEFVHRYALLKIQGEPPKEKPLALHNCHNRACFNPKHLRWGTQKENMHDRIKDQTDNSGIRNGRAKLSIDMVKNIRNDFRTHRQIAKDYHIDSSTVTDIKNHKLWSSVI